MEQVAVGETVGRQDGDASWRRRTLISLTACHGLNDLYGIVMPPLLPLLRETFSLSFTQAGVLPFVALALSSVSQPLLGYLADRRGIRVPLMGVGFLVFAGAMLIMGSAGSYPTLLLAVVALGIGASTYHPQSATLLAYHFKNERGKAQGIHGIGNGLGFMAAPLLVGFLGQQFGFQPTAYLLIIPGLIGALVVWTQLREPPVVGTRGLLAGVNRNIVLLTLVTGMGLGVGTGFMTWLPSYYFSQVGSYWTAGLLTAALSIAALIAQPIGGAVSDRIGRRNVLLASVLGASIPLTFFLLAPGIGFVVLLSVLVGFCQALMPPVSMVYASELATGERTGMAVGIVWGLGIAVASVFPLATGALIDHWGFNNTFLALAAVGPFAALLATRLPRA